MVVIFEDSEHKGTSRLFREAYKNKEMFKYSNGNSELVNTLLKVLKETKEDELIAVYMDMVPGNKYIKRYIESLEV